MAGFGDELRVCAEARFALGPSPTARNSVAPGNDQLGTVSATFGIWCPAFD